MPDRFTQRILKHLSDQRYAPLQVRLLAQALGVEDDDLDAFKRAVDQLHEADQLVIGSTSEVTLPPPGREMVGVVRMHERGFGFLVPDIARQHGDLFIPNGNAAGALTGDRIRARVIHQKGRGGRGRSPYIGRVVEILQRAEKKYVGTLCKRGTHFVVEVDGKFLHEPIVIRDPHSRNAKVGDKVVIDLIEYPSDNELGEGAIIEVLGESGEPAIETLGVMRAYGMTEKFDDAVVADARKASKQLEDEKSAFEGREDLRDKFICTIDPPDARDFDDAISIERLNDGKAAYELGVHIADVSNYVQPGSPLDVEAKQRANSVYLPRKVIPMLPELLSNGVCSLQEGVPRLCMSAFIQLDADGNMVGERFAKTVIHSAKRMTYLEAQALIDDDIKEARKNTRSEPNYSKQLIDTVKLMDELARKIRKRRLEGGMIVLGLPEVELIFDDTGRVVDAEPEDDAFTHKIIEMFMVEANEAAARLFNNLDVPMIRRIHPDPPAHDTNDLRQFARVAGFNIPQNPTPQELQQLLDAVRGKPAQHAVHMAVLRTLSQAEYAPMLVGHFALASEHYTHFTSPIRRYTDLVVHRAISAFLEAKNSKAIKGEKNRDKAIKGAMFDDPRCPPMDVLQEVSRHCSANERNAQAAERELRNYLVLELMANHLGDDFAGTCTGVTANGIFVQIDRFLVDGFIPVADISATFGNQNDRWRLNRNTGALVADRSGRVIQLGDQFRVRVAKVDLTRRKLELVIVSDRPNKAVGGKGKGKGSGKGKGKVDGKGKDEGGATKSAGTRKKTSKKRTQGKGSKKAHGNSMSAKRKKKSSSKGGRKAASNRKKKGRRGGGSR